MTRQPTSSSRRTPILNSVGAWLRLNGAWLLVLALFLVAVAVVYGNDLAILANEALQNEAFSHLLIFPFLLGFLFYLKKDVIKATLLLGRTSKSKTRYVNEISGAALCLVALILYWYGSSTFYPLEYHIASLPIFIMGTVLIVSNARTLIMLIFPILFIFFLVPLPTTLLYTAGGALASVNTQIAYAVLRLTGMPVSLSTSYGAPTLQLATASGAQMNFSVDVPCSGIYSLVAFTMIAAFIAFISSSSIRKKALVFISGFVIFWALNLFRIGGIVSVANFFGEQTALVLHQYAGMILIFVGIILVLLFSQKVLKVTLQTKPQPQNPCSECMVPSFSFRNFCGNCGRFLNNSRVKFSRSTVLKLLVLIIGCSVAVLSINAPTFITSEGNFELSSTTGAQTSVNVFPDILGYNLTFLNRDTAYERLAQQDASLLYGYYPVSSSDARVYADIGVSGSMSTLHNWEVCYVTYQTAQGKDPLVEVLDSSEVELLPETSLIAKYFIFDSSQDYVQATLYWFGKATFKTDLTVEPKYYRISLMIIGQNADDVPSYKQQLLAVAQSVASAMEPLKSQAALSLGVPTLQFLLIGAIAFLAVTKIGQNLREQKKRTANRVMFNNFATKDEKMVLESIEQLSEKGRHMRTSDIIENVEKQVGKPVNHERVHTILRTLEDFGFISREVVSNENVPSLVWKAEMETENDEVDLFPD